MSKSRRICGWVLGVLMAWGGPAFAEGELPSAKEAVNGYDGIVERVVTSGKAVDEMREDIKGEMESFVDYNELARLTIK